jgi:outer membrane protein assembly factor BamB
VRSLAPLDGQPIMSSQWRPYGTSQSAPVPYGEFVYVQGRVSLRAYGADGTVKWEVPNGEPYALAAPAVDEANVYAISSSRDDNSVGAIGNLQVFDRSTGALLASIGHPAASGVSGRFSAVLGGRGNVVARVGCEGAYCRLASVDIASRAWTWTSATLYRPASIAVANGVIYALRGTTTIVDAINEATGEILWSRTLPGGESGPNLIVTRNLLFVGSDTATYAMSLESGASVYEFPRSSVIALSADRTLYLGRPYLGDTVLAGLVAFRLQ